MFTKRHLATLIALMAVALATLPFSGGVAKATPSIDPRFTTYYNQHQGVRVLGYPITELTEVSGYAAQFFEKGCLEDHRGEVSDPRWQFMYGRLSAALMERDSGGAVSGTSMTYGDLALAARPALRQAPPEGFVGGTKGVHDGVFVPFDPYLRRNVGYVVAPYFWAYMNRAELFPGGWLHDLGLPMTDVLNAKVVKNGEERTVFVQAFERAVLTYDMRNPAGWQVEKGNIGSDAMRTHQPVPIPPSATRVEIPLEGAKVMLPVHILAWVGKPGAQVMATLKWQDGTKLSNTFTLLRGEDREQGERGLLIGNLDWINALNPPQPRTQSATLEIRSATGSVLLAQRTLTVVGQNDLGTQEVKLYWTVSGTELVQPQVRRVISSPSVASRTLEELLWGPPAISQVGFGTSIPTPEQVLSYPGRQSDWGPRVTLRKLTITGGVATADFSKEMKAYGGGSLRVKLIHDQITSTLKQFPACSRW